MTKDINFDVQLQITLWACAVKFQLLAQEQAYPWETYQSTSQFCLALCQACPGYTEPASQRVLEPTCILFWVFLPNGVRQQAPGAHQLFS